MSWIKSAFHVSITIYLCFLVTSEAKRKVNREREGSNRDKEQPQCAVFPTPYSDVLRAGVSSFIELGRMDVGRDFHIEMEVRTAFDDHDGNLFAIGSKRVFPYYEWRSAANTTQYLVVEIVYSSVVLTLKALGTFNLHSIEIYRTFPNSYKIGDGQWHKIKAWRSPGYWHLELDGEQVKEELRIGPDNSNNGPSDSTDVKLEDQEAFLGGRPGYIDLQFRGLIRNLKINGAMIPLKTLETSDDNVLVNSCNSRLVRNFESQLDKEMAKRKKEERQKDKEHERREQEEQDDNNHGSNGQSEDIFPDEQTWENPHNGGLGTGAY